MDLTNKDLSNLINKEEMFEMIQQEEHFNNEILIKGIFENLENFTRDEKSVLEDIWSIKIDNVDGEINELMDNRAELELSLVKNGMTLRKIKSKKAELNRQADRLERAKFRKMGV